MKEVQVVNEQIKHYEAGNIKAFTACYSPDAICEFLPSNRRIASGHGEIEAVWGKLFQSQKLKVEIVSRIVLGKFVIDHERVTNMNENSQSETVACYQVEDSLISHVWFLQT